MERFITQINEKINHKENFIRLSNLQQKLVVVPDTSAIDDAAVVSLPKTNLYHYIIHYLSCLFTIILSSFLSHQQSTNLLANDRRYIMEGRVSKVGNFAIVSERYAFLFSDMLLITKPRGDQFVMYRKVRASAVFILLMLFSLMFFFSL